MTIISGNLEKKNISFPTNRCIDESSGWTFCALLSAARLFVWKKRTKIDNSAMGHHYYLNSEKKKKSIAFS